MIMRRPGAMLGIVLALSGLVTTTGCNDRSKTRGATADPAFASPQHEVSSRSGRYLLKMVQTPADNGVRAASFQILTTDRTVAFENPTRYSLNHTTLMCWADKSDEVWVYSGDTGTDIVTKVGSGGWTKHSLGPQDKPLAPEALRRARPNTFDKNRPAGSPAPR
jgi:hypothetical protein